MIRNLHHPQREVTVGITARNFYSGTVPKLCHPQFDSVLFNPRYSENGTTAPEQCIDLVTL